MDNLLIDVKQYDGVGYKSLVSFGAWRVAVLRYLDDLQPDRINSMERHLDTDEVFVLVKGKAMLVLGGNSLMVEELSFYPMTIGDIYNVKQNTWHTLILSQDAHLIIVENDDTEKGNSQYATLSSGHQLSTQVKAREFLK